MKSEIYASNINPFSKAKSYKIRIDLPSKCPRCDTAYSSQPFSSVYVKSEFGNPAVYSTFFCPVCNKCFFVHYSIVSDYSDEVGILSEFYPASETKTDFSSAIKTVSPDFVNIFNQSEQAENRGLDDICGIGYRKSLEFLIKDYAISLNPDKRSEIESSFLGNCISNYIDNEKIKTLAKASAWIGNDETHYVRKNQNHNVQDLKRFIKTVVAYIEYEFNYSEALELLSNPQ